MSTTNSRFPIIALVVVALLALGPALAQAQQAVSGPSKVAVIDVRRILTESESGRAALETLSALAETEYARLEEMKTEIETMQERLTAGALSLSEEKQEEMNAELRQKMIDYRRAEDDARQKIEDTQAEQFGAIEERVMPLIAEIGEEQGFTLIFNKFEDSGLLWAQPTADITAMVLERFNALPES